MRYAQIRDMDISNGTGIGVSLFVQGCRFHCKNCFNQSTWDFFGGELWTVETQKHFIELIDRPYIKRVSILGGEPLADENVDDIGWLLNDIRDIFGKTKTIWLYTGYTFEEIFKSDDLRPVNIIRQNSAKLVDVLVDGRFVEEKKDLSYPFAGSTNQRVLDMEATLRAGEIILLPV